MLKMKYIKAYVSLWLRLIFYRCNSRRGKFSFYRETKKVPSKIILKSIISSNTLIILSLCAWHRAINNPLIPKNAIL